MPLTRANDLTHCTDELPALGVTRQFDFGQFIELFDPGVGPNPVPVPIVVDPIGNLKLAEVLRQPATSGTAFAGFAATGTGDQQLGGRSLQALLARAALAADDATASVVEVALSANEVAGLLASGRVSVAGVMRDVELSPSAVRDLLAGLPVELPLMAAGGGLRQRVRVVPPSGQPAPGVYGIADLSGFLADPRVPGAAGLLVPIALSATQVEALRTVFVTEVSVPGGVLRLMAVSSVQSASTGVTPVSGGGGVAVSGGGTGTVASTGSGGGITVVGGTGGPRPAEVRPNGLRGRVEGRLPTGRGIPVAVLVPWRQTWTLTGFSRGALLSSLALTPQEEVVIELRTWERRVRSLEQSSETETEQSFDSSETSKDSDETFRELTSKQDFTWQVAGSLDVSYSPGVASVELSASASAESVRNLADVSRTTATRMRESTNKAAAKVRARRTTRISESIETGSENRITRRLRNANHTRTVTYDFFETLAHYSVSLEFQPERLTVVALIRNPELREPADFDETLVRQNETTFRNALLDPSLAEGFAALRRLAAYRAAVSIVAAREAEAKLAESMRKPVVPASNASAADPDPAAAQLAAVMEALGHIHEGARLLGENADVDRALVVIRSQAENGSRPMNEDERRKAQYWLFVHCLAARMPSLLDGLQALAAREVVSLTVADAQRLAAVLPSQAAPRSLASLSELTAREKEEAGLASAINRFKRVFWDWDWWTMRCREESLYTPNDAGIVGHADLLLKALEAWEAKRSEGALKKDKDIALKQADGAQSSAEKDDVLSMAFPVDEHASAVERADALLGHIAAHPHHYSYALFQALTPSEQVARILRSSGGQLQVGLFEPRVVAMHGDKLAIPLTPLAVGGLEAFMTTLRNSLTAALNDARVRPDTVVLPTPGVNVASRLGNCSSAESFIEDSREVDVKLARARLRQAEAEADAAEAEARRRKLRLEEKMLDPFVEPSV